MASRPPQTPSPDTNADDTIMAAMRLLSTADGAFVYTNNNLAVGQSLGVAETHGKEKHSQRLLRIKRTGERVNCICFTTWTTSMDERQVAKQHSETGQSAILDNKQIVPIHRGWRGGVKRRRCMMWGKRLREYSLTEHVNRCLVSGDICAESTAVRNKNKWPQTLSGVDMLFTLEISRLLAKSLKTEKKKLCYMSSRTDGSLIVYRSSYLSLSRLFLVCTRVCQRVCICVCVQEMWYLHFIGK